MHRKQFRPNFSYYYTRNGYRNPLYIHKGVPSFHFLLLYEKKITKTMLIATIRYLHCLQSSSRWSASNRYLPRRTIANLEIITLPLKYNFPGDPTLGPGNVPNTLTTYLSAPTGIFLFGINPHFYSSLYMGVSSFCSFETRRGGSHLT